jgi:uncharacterized membrane protein
MRIRSIRFELAGLILGTICFALSLTPSLVPRPFVIQGALAGVSFAIGYATACIGVAIWHYLQLPIPRGRARRIVWIVAGSICLLLVVSFLWQSSSWQNALRLSMGLEATSTLQPMMLGLVSLGVFLVLWIVAKLFRFVWSLTARKLDRFIPRRVARIVGGAVALVLFWMIVDGLLISALLRAADRYFQLLDALIDDDLPVPTDTLAPGSAESLIAWKDLGRMGRQFVAFTPTSETLSEFFNAPTPAPIRVYVGLNSADNPEARAQLALDELIRVGGFERSTLLLVTPTGTGWVDPASQDPVEYLLRGDVATVAVQYSYLNSPLSLLTQAAYGVETAQAVFKRVYGHWRTLPRETRPKLYLHGLSLGSLNSDRSFDFFDIIDDPFDGALWSGPPFRHETWRSVTAQRDPGTPQWLPVFRRGAVVRFMSQAGLAPGNTAVPGAFRIVFLQYASDPIVFYSPGSAWREPEWMKDPRGPDVSANLRWFPIITMLQLGADTMVGTPAPGFGHRYAAEDYIDAWLELLGPLDWSRDDLARLKARFAERVIAPPSSSP